MGLLDSLRGNPFGKLKLEEIRGEKISVEHQRRLLLNELNDITKQRRKAFEKGFDASDNERTILAQELSMLDNRGKMKNAQFRRLNQQVMVLDGLMFMKENEKFLKQQGVLDRVLKMDAGLLAEKLAQHHQVFQEQGIRMEEILKVIGAEVAVMEEGQLADQTKEVMDVWKSADKSQLDVAAEFEKLEKKRSAREETN